MDFNRRTGQGKDPKERRKNRGRLKQKANRLHDLAVDDRLLDALEEARSDNSALAKFRADPQGYIQSKGVNVPDDMEVEFDEENSYRVCLFYWDESFYGVIYTCFYVY